MPSPFPGMDPWLEHPDHWQDVHTRLVVALADTFGSSTAQVRPVGPRTFHAEAAEGLQAEKAAEVVRRT